MMTRVLRSFSADERGGIALISAIAVPLGIMAIGCAVDYAGASNLKAKLQDATDATALVAAKAAPSMSDKDLLALATKAFKSSISNPTAKIESLKVKSGRRKIEVDASAVAKTAFLGFIGYKDLPVGAFSESVASDDTYEIAIVMDNSGSMASSAGGSSKMQSAKDAAKKLVDAMMTSQSASNRTKFSIVPFTLTVKIGSEYANASWMDRLGQSSIHFENLTVPPGAVGLSRFNLFTALNVPWAGCVETRPGSYGFNDAAPTPSEPDSLFVPMAAPDEPGNGGATSYKFGSGSGATSWSYPNSYISDNPHTCVGGDVSESGEYVEAEKKICKYLAPSSLNTSSGRGPNYSCNARPLLRLTNDTSALHASINAMTADGNTNLLEGFAWGWRTLSPNAPFADGSAYKKANNRKIIVFLTDGMNVWSSANNHNKSIYSPFGYYTNARLGPAPANADEARAQIDAKTLATCTNAKAEGVTVYTVGFSVGSSPIDSAGLDLLKNCATSTQHAYVANDSSTIVAVFEEIARSIGGLRLTQ